MSSSFLIVRASSSSFPQNALSSAVLAWIPVGASTSRRAAPKDALVILAYSCMTPNIITPVLIGTEGTNSSSSGTFVYNGGVI